MSFGFGMGFPRSFNAAGGPSLNFQFAGSTALDPRITFTRASTATYFDSTGTLQSAAINAARLDYNPATLAAQGLLIEEQRTNSIRNNTMQGAVAGTPGTLPTNWTIGGGGLGTLTTQVVGVGMSSGITYIDWRVSGTTSTLGFILAFEPSTQIAALTGQAWSQSFYIALVGGSIANISILRHNVVERASGGTMVVQNFSADFKAALTANLNRFSYSPTLNGGATTAFVQPAISFDFSSGVAIDITLRIGLPQLEQGAFATSVIPTTTTALTRAADSAVMSGTNFSSWYNQTEGTLFVEWMTPSADAVNNRGIAAIDDGTNNNRVALFTPGQAAPLTVSARVVSGGVATNPASAGSIALSSNAKSALAYAVGTNQAALCVNGGTPATASPAATPVGQNVLRIGAIFGVNSIGGYIKRLAYYPRRLSNAELQSITA